MQLKRLLSVVYLLFALAGCEDNGHILQPKVVQESCYDVNNQKAVARVLTIKKSKSGGEDSGWYKRFLITHISDTHVANGSVDNNVVADKSVSCKNLKEAVRFSNQRKSGENTPLLGINCMVVTGDLINSWKTERRLQFLNRFDYFMEFYNKDNHIPALFCTGNHDAGFIAQDTVDWLTKEDIYQHATQKINTPVSGLAGENYFYKDIENQMGSFVRLISLDVLDQTGTTYYTQQHATYSQKQIDWLCNVALKENMTSGHSVIILNHFPFFSTDFEKKTGLRSGDSYSHNRQMIPEIVEAFRKKESLVKTFAPHDMYVNKPGASSIVVNVDFSSTPGEFVCYLGGHIHASSWFYVSDYANISPNLKPQLMILCTNQSPREAGVQYNKVYREENTVTSNAFQIYAVDTEEGNIYMTYFGAYIPADNPLNPEIEKINYR